MTNGHNNRLPIRCYECSAVSRLLARINDDTADFVCANGHVWRDNAPLERCAGCDQPLESHVELSARGSAPFLVCPRLIHDNLYKRR